MRLSMLLLVLTLAAGSAFAQARDPIAGAWEGLGGKNLKTGAALQPANPALHVIFANGQYVQFAAGAGRPKTTTALEQMTKEQLLERFRGVQGQYGTYRVDGTKLIRRIVSAAAPINEGREVAGEFKMEGDILVVTAADAQGQMIENRYRRIR